MDKDISSKGGRSELDVMSSIPGISPSGFESENNTKGSHHGKQEGSGMDGVGRLFC